MKVMEKSYILVSSDECREKVVLSLWLVFIKVIKKSYILVSDRENHEKCHEFLAVVYFF